MQVKIGKILIICGPSATGKTELGVRLAKAFQGEIISADSRQIYRGMDIGTGKDLRSKNILSQYTVTAHIGDMKYEVCPYDYSGIPLWLYDVVNPDEEFSVVHFGCIARKIIQSIVARGRLPIIVGGTGLYIRELTHPIPTAQIPTDEKDRIELSGKNLSELQQILHHESPNTLKSMNMSDRQNPRRLTRKIELVRWYRNHPLSNTLLSDNRNDTDIIDFYSIGLNAPNSELYRRIDERVEKRIAQGLLSEIRALLENGYSFGSPAFSALGYREWDGAINVKGNLIVDSQQIRKIIERWKFDEHAYVRRQLTWFRKQPGIIWYDITSPSWFDSVRNDIDTWYNKGNTYAIKN